MTILARGRYLRVNQTVVAQADFFQVDGYTRVPGLTFVNLSSELFFDNALQPWVLTNGATVPDGLVTAGNIYIHEIAGAPGHYSLRFRPNVAGYWRLLLTYAAGQQIVAQDYDVTAESQALQGTLKTSFV
jgi:hypothetical protein